MALIDVQFPGGKRVDAHILGHDIPTDQAPQSGGEGAAPEPFQLFLASIATCAGIYAKSFCDQRNLDAPLGLEMDLTRGDDGLISRLDMVLRVAADFPERYEQAITTAMNLCAVKKHLRAEMETVIQVAREDQEMAI